MTNQLNFGDLCFMLLEEESLLLAKRKGGSEAPTVYKSKSSSTNADFWCGTASPKLNPKTLTDFEHGDIAHVAEGRLLSRVGCPAHKVTAKEGMWEK